MQLGALRPLILAGGAAGALVRWLIGSGLDDRASNFPWGTFAVNIVGCALLGHFLTSSPGTRRDALTIGFCGGLTTFSTLMVELIRKSESNQLGDAFVYLLLSLTLGIAAFLAGRRLAPARSGEQ